MSDAVVEFGKFRLIPAVGSSDEVAGDALQAVDVGAATFGASFETRRGVFVAAIDAAVAVVVHRAVAHVESIHHFNDTHDSLGVVGGIAVDFNIENMAATSEVVVGSLDFSFVAGTAFVVHRHVVGIGVVIAVGDARNYAEFLAVDASETP